MNIIYDSFLKMINAGLTDCSETTKRNPSSIILSESQWNELFIISDKHELLPFIFDLCCNYKLADTLEPSQIKSYQTMALQIAIRQITQTNEFLTIIQHAQKKGLDPIVMKGIVCRSLYPKPYLRPSVDEDLLVTLDEASAFHRFLISEGLFADDPDADPEAVSELSYHKENSPTYIELHKKLFDPDSDVFGDFNILFDGILDRTIRVQIEDVSVRTVAPTDHLLYLLLHAFKHFVHSGIGIRAVCDIGMFSEHYASEVDWEHIHKSLEQVQAFDFARALYSIVKTHLLPEAAFFEGIEDWKLGEIDIEPLLDDILASGVHGNSSLERLHSSNITLNAVAHGHRPSNTKAPKQTNSLGNIFHTIFLPLDKMSNRFTYLKKAPVLLPVAWGQRIFWYLKENATSKREHTDPEKSVTSKNRAAETIRLGQSRVELLKKYGIIK